MLRVGAQLLQTFAEVALPEYLHVAVTCQRPSVQVNNVVGQASGKWLAACGALEPAVEAHQALLDVEAFVAGCPEQVRFMVAAAFMSFLLQVLHRVCVPS